MPFEPSSAVGYAPSIEELLQDVDVSSEEEYRDVLFDRCRRLYASAKEKGNIYLFQQGVGTINELIICESAALPQTLVNIGHGNCALSIVDERSPDAFLFLFHDKIPEIYFPVAAAHESMELYENRRGTGVVEGHIAATRAELSQARALGLEKEYLAFVRERYPGKLPELKDAQRAIDLMREAQPNRVR